MRRILLIALLVSATYLPAHDVRVGVLGLFHPRELEVRPLAAGVLRVEAGDQTALLESNETLRLVLEANAIAWSIGGRSGRAATIRITGRDGGPADFIVVVPAKIHRHYRGTLAVTATAGVLQPVVVMDLELAVASVVAAESPPNPPIEALKSQAVVARSYFVAGAQHRDFDFCDTTHCQFLRDPPALNSPPWQATRQTAGLVLTYEGAPLAAMYTAACGGRTRSLSEIGVKARGYPYFAVECKYCQRNPQSWKAELSAEEAEALLKDPGERERLAIDRRRGWKTIPGNNYRASMNGDRVLLTGTGAGHGVGLCQRGAASMAADGATFQEILAHYYPNTSLTRVATEH